MKKKSKERQPSGSSNAADGNQDLGSLQQIQVEPGADTEFALDAGTAASSGTQGNSSMTAGTRRYLAEIAALQTLADIQARNQSANGGNAGGSPAKAVASEEFSSEVAPPVNQAAQSSPVSASTDAAAATSASVDHSARLAEISALQELSDEQSRLDANAAPDAISSSAFSEEYSAELAPAPQEDHTETIRELSALQAMSDAQARADRAAAANPAVPAAPAAHEEYAAEVAPPLTTHSIRQPVSKAEGQESAGATSAMKWIGYTAIILAVLSLFMAPALLGSSAALFGFFAFVLGQRAIGALSILIGLISLAGYFILVPLYA
ncbi:MULTISPECIES: hypothetical protein [Paenibacillus]|uniref:hypothetical protein n=1 Tax=Paenibacillus TaxID=44249 RepID=UPI0022B9256E|nr:hypothetical protein [Paenibacillus caseinilyticus]MCZ8518738.1 hypothetical protein [Paenibacillus caseinilyticus]